MNSTKKHHMKTFLRKSIAVITMLSVTTIAQSQDGAAAVIAEPITNYEENLTLFYWLSTSILVLLISIVVLSSSITTLVKSDYFKKKMAEKTKLGTGSLNVVLIIGFIGLLLHANTANALSFVAAGEAKENSPWLLVEKMDLYFMVAINLILVGVVLYLRKMFRDFMEMVHTPKETTSIAPSAIKKINVILTDAVAIEEEHTILMQHEYDGIRELDNNLPPWWVWGFYTTIVFAVIYVFNFHILRTSDLQIEAYNKEVSQGKKDVEAYLAEMAMNVDETNVTLLSDANAISAGSALFQANCIACHNSKGEGNIGPNLTDNHWIYGPDIKDVFKTIKKGTPNGMPEHASKMNPVQLQQLSSFVLSLPDATGKEPQGIEYKDGKAVK
jgi:cytochrome c oxidase cbb3-type subunit 3